jgi:predicted DsbA family dithiol-disulfide isomerase
MDQGGSTELEIYADIWCPFAYVGILATFAERERSGAAMSIHVRSWPLELVNSKPLDPAITSAHATELREQVAPDLFANLDLSRFPTTSLPALGLAAAAYRTSMAHGEKMSLRLRRALFEEGADISDDAVLQALASELGVEGPTPDDMAVVSTDWATGQRRGVLGSPHFFCGAEQAFCPGLAIERTEAGDLKVSRRIEGMSEFLGTCFASA